MATQALTSEQCLEALEALKQHGTHLAAADALDISRGAFENRLRTAIKRGLDEAIVHPAPAGHAVKGVSTLYGPAGNVVAQWVKTKTNEIPLEELIEHLNGAFDGVPALPIVPAPKKTAKGLVSVYPLIDWHIGLMAWSQETGTDWDLKIARSTIMEAMRAVIAATPPAEEAVVLGIGDLLHFDGYVPQTPHSKHPLDADSRYPKVLETAADMVEETIELALGHHKRVFVRILPGNHDPVSSVAMTLALHRTFRRNARVTLDSGQGYYWWRRFGKVFLGGTHGDKAKMKDLPLVMAHDRPDDWAASTYRRIYAGHFHNERSIEEGGVLVTTMRTPVARDAYHSFEKYRSGRSVYSETFKIDGSEAAVMKINL